MFQEIIAVGRLGRDPELTQGKSGTAICNFSIACTTKYSDKEETEWFNVVLFSKSAENAAKYLAKGNLCLVKGRLQTTSYEKDGQKKFNTKLIGETWKNLTPKAAGASMADETNGQDVSDVEVPF